MDVGNSNWGKLKELGTAFWASEWRWGVYVSTAVLGKWAAEKVQRTAPWASMAQGFGEQHVWQASGKKNVGMAEHPNLFNKS